VITISIDLSGQQFGQIMDKLDQILKGQKMAAATLDDLVSDTTAQTTVVGSVVTLLQGLSAQLAAAIASGNPAKIQAAADAISANTKALADAVAANTPGGPTPPPVGP